MALRVDGRRLVQCWPQTLALYRKRSAEKPANFGDLHTKRSAPQTLGSRRRLILGHDKPKKLRSTIGDCVCWGAVYLRA